MHFVDTNTVILKKNIYQNVFVCTEKTTLTANFCAILYKSLSLCSTDQLTVDIIRNSRKIDIYKNCMLICYDVICVLPHEVVVYDIQFFATSYFFNK